MGKNLELRSEDDDILSLMTYASIVGISSTLVFGAYSAMVVSSFLGNSVKHTYYHLSGIKHRDIRFPDGSPTDYVRTKD